MRESAASSLPRRDRESMPQIAITPAGPGFAVRIDGKAVRYCGDELDAHHWGKHAFEAVNRGLRRASEIEVAMGRLCLTATRHNLHT
jgi:hypothetical protein